MCPEEDSSKLRGFRDGSKDWFQSNDLDAKTHLDWNNSVASSGTDGTEGTSNGNKEAMPHEAQNVVAWDGGKFGRLEINLIYEGHIHIVLKEKKPEKMAFISQWTGVTEHDAKLSYFWANTSCLIPWLQRSLGFPGVFEGEFWAATYKNSIIRIRGRLEHGSFKGEILKSSSRAYFVGSVACLHIL